MLPYFKWKGNSETKINANNSRFCDSGKNSPSKLLMKARDGAYTGGKEGERYYNIRGIEENRES